MRAMLSMAAAVLLVGGVAGCGGAEGETKTESERTPCTPAGAPPSGEAASREMDSGHYDPELFAGAAAENRWYPLRPGTRLFYRGSSLEDGERLHHTVDVVVTDLVKVVDGVPNVVVWERDYTEGELVETELALFATDRHGNVWHMGEYPEEYEDGELVATPAWVHGLEGACAGVTIPGDPTTGTSDYAQGYAPPPIEWVDRGRVYKTGTRTCVPAGCYDGVVVVEEFETGLPDAFQDKHYAPDLGVVRVGWRGSKDESKEVLELVRAERLTPDELAGLRRQALRLEERANAASEDVWARTGPAERG